jgi:single-stranded-DNA-specific exonuclease
MLTGLLLSADARFLRHFGVVSEIYIPDRIFEGYGPNPAAIGELVDRGPV